MGQKHFDFGWKYKSYELRACPKHLARLSPEEPNETIDLVFWKTDSNGTDYCFSVAYFCKYSEGYYLRFVGDRPFQYIDASDVPIVWDALNAAQKILEAFFSVDDEEGDQ